VFRCHVCGNTAAKNKHVSEVFTVGAHRALVEHIPAQVCERCGEATFSRETMDGSALDIVTAGSPASNVLNNGPGFASLSHVHDNLMGLLSCCGIAYLVTNVSSVPHAIVMTYGALLNRYPYIPGLVNQAER